MLGSISGASGRLARICAGSLCLIASRCRKVGSAVLSEYNWAKREIENYFCFRDVLMRWAETEGSLFRNSMVDAITEVEAALATLNQGSPWDGDMKVSDLFLPPVFQAFYQKTGITSIASKSDYHFLVNHIEPDEIDPEVISVLDTIAEVAANVVTPS